MLHRPTRREIVAKLHPEHAWPPHSVAAAVEKRPGLVVVDCACGAQLAVLAGPTKRLGLDYNDVRARLLFVPRS